MLPFGGGAAAEKVIERISLRTGVEVPATWEGPVCFSRDRIQPVVLEGQEVLSDTCAECTMNRWRTVNGRRSQDCAESYRLLAFDLVLQRSCVLFARGSAIRPIRELLATLQTLCERHQKPVYGFAVYALTKRVDGSDGQPYHVPVFHTPYPLDDPKQVAFYATLRRKLSAADAEEAA